MTYYVTNWLNGQKLTKKQKAKLKNDIEFRNVLNDLVLKSLDLFQYDTTIKTWNSRMHEMSCISNGSSILAHLDNGAFVNLISAPDGSLTLYGDPAGAFGYGLNGFTNHFNLFVPGEEKIYTIGKQGGNVNAILCKDNELMFPFMSYLVEYASRIADVQRSLDVLTSGLKAPRIITCDERRVTDVKGILDAIDTNTSVVVGVGSLPYDKLESIDTGVNAQSVSVLYDYLCDMKSQVMELIGINSNPAAQKKERNLVDEINANNEQTGISLSERLKTREQFCEYCREFWGLDLTVSIKEREGTDYDSNDSETHGETGEHLQQNTTWEED